MTKFILSQRSFKPEYLDQMKKIAPQFQFITEIHAKEDWENVAVTIGWQKEWQPLLASNSNLKWVQSISAGVDYLPLNDFESKNILLTNAKGIHNEAAIGQRHKKWSQAVFYGKLEEQKILIIGTGQIGQELAKTLKLLGNQPIGVNTTGHKVANFEQTFAISQLKSIVKQFDFVINILPLTTQTHHLYDADFFNAMKHTATFVNVGRGASVDTSALLVALQKRSIAYAALDVFEEEPLLQTNPLWQLDNILITPHIAGMVPRFQQKFMAIFLQNLTSFVSNQSVVKNQVDLKKGY